MGGFLSTRWNYTPTRADTDGLLYLDIAALRRMGALDAGAEFWQQWANGRGEIVGSIRTVTNAARDTLTLLYGIRLQCEAWHPVQEDIGLEATPCHYGGERLWLTCPGCQSRRRVLYSMEGRFRCRLCHDLAYTSTREDDLARSQRRARKLQKCLGAADGRVLEAPLKPRGMHWRTYERIANDLRAEHDMRTRYVQALLDKQQGLLATLETGSEGT